MERREGGGDHSGLTAYNLRYVRKRTYLLESLVHGFWHLE